MQKRLTHRHLQSDNMVVAEIVGTTVRDRSERSLILDLVLQYIILIPCTDRNVPYYTIYPCNILS